MGTYETSRQFEQPYPKVWNAFGQALEMADFALKQADPKQGSVSGQPPIKRTFPGISFRARLAQKGKGTLVILSITQWGVGKGRMDQEFQHFWEMMDQVLDGKNISVNYMERARAHQRWGTGFLGLALMCILMLTFTLLEFLEDPVLSQLPIYIIMLVCTGFLSLFGIKRMDLASHNVLLHLKREEQGIQPWHTNLKEA